MNLYRCQFGRAYGEAGQCKAAATHIATRNGVRETEDGGGLVWCEAHGKSGGYWEREPLDLPDVALSIRQPWAWLIVNGHKGHENREWSGKNPGRKFRGPVLIHAAKGMTEAEYDEAWFTARRLGIAVPGMSQLERGGIVGVAEVVGWEDEPPAGMKFAYGSGLRLTNMRPLPFRACQGALGFFKPVVDWEAAVVMPELRCKCGWQGLKSERAEVEDKRMWGVYHSVCPACQRRELWVVGREAQKPHSESEEYCTPEGEESEPERLLL